MKTPETIKVAAVQMSAGTDKAANLAEAVHWIEAAAQAGARIVALPEVFIYRGSQEHEARQSEAIPGPTTKTLSKTAKKHGIYLVAGSILETIPTSEKVYNTCVVFNDAGEIISCYRKIHLFGINIDPSETISEALSREYGTDVTVADTPYGKFGLSICYDLRFPELYRALGLRGATLVFVPAAFLTHTGKDHWKVLLRARAIENQVYVIAPNAFGKNVDTGTLCYGRSLIIDPWGTVLAQAPDRAGIITAEVDFGYLAQIRQKLPCLENRRLEFSL